MKKCTKCGKEKELGEFNKSSRGSKDGLGSWCKACMYKTSVEYTRKRLKTDTKYRKEYTRKCTEYMRKRKKIDPEFRQKHREYSIAYNLKRLYGITLKQYTQMLSDQNGVCKICGGINKGGRKLHVDHSHVTGKIRGLLCHTCNIKLSALKDTIFLHRANIYLSNNI